MTKRVKMKQKTDSFVVHYPEAIEFADTQMKILWFPNEIKVEKDVHDILTNMTLAERHGVVTVLKLFTLYEAKAGTDYWTGRFMRTYKRPEFQRMASVFGMFELAIHAPFYNLINEALHLNTDEFYESYVQDETLKSRMDFVDSGIRDKDDLFSVGVFSLVEGAVLYSSFAFLKHFQSKGKNKLLNVVRGINFSVRDENCLEANTEVKCIGGWKKITEVTLDDLVLQYDQSTKTFVYDTPYNIVKTTSDTSYHFIGNNYEQIVTPNHRMILEAGEVLAKEAVDNMNYLAYSNETFSVDNTVIVSKLTHTPKDFYCLSVDKGAFVVKYNDKVSITGNCHSVAGAWVFRKHLEEEQRSPEEVKELHNRIIEAANTIYEHESRIVDMIFEQGDIEGIDSAKLKMFVKSRINICLSNLGISPIFEIVDNQIETWFYDSINKFTFNDFFSGIGREYTRDWEESNFTWKKKAE